MASLITFDAAGSLAFGALLNSTTTGAVTWSHTAAAGALAFIYPAVLFSTLPSGLTASVTYGGVTVNAIAPVLTNSGANSAAVWVFAISKPLTGAQTISCTMSWTGAANYYVGGISMSYKGVGAIGQLETNNGQVTAMTVTGQSQLGRLTTGQITTFSSQSGFSQTSRVATSGTGFVGAQIGGDGLAAQSVFSATSGSTNPWVATAIDLIPGRNFGMPLNQSVQRAALV